MEPTDCAKKMWQCFKKADDAKIVSYNLAAKKLGLSLPIKMGIMQMGDLLEDFVWFNGKVCVPVFENSKLSSSFRYNRRCMSFEVALPGCYFAHNNKMYYYAEEDLTLYRVSKYLNIVILKMFADLKGIFFEDYAFGQIYGRNDYVWAIKPLAMQGYCEWELPSMCIIPVFEETEKILESKELTWSDINLLLKGDDIIYDDDIYVIGEDEYMGVSLIKQEIDIDLTPFGILPPVDSCK